MARTIDVDTSTFVRFWLVILGFVLAALFIWKALPALIIIGIAIFLTIAIQPLAERINRLMRGKRPVLSAVLGYVIVIGVLGLIVAVVGPMVVEQTVQFVQQLPTTFETTLGGWDGINHFGQGLGIDNLQGEIATALQTFSSNFVANLSGLLVSGVGAVAQLMTGVILVLVLTLLFTLEGPAIVKGFWKMLGGKRRGATVRAYQEVVERMVGVVRIYIGRQVMVAVLDGLVVTVAVLLLSLFCGFSGGLAFPLGLIAMTFYLIPMFGPIISCILNSLLLLLNSPVAAVVFLIFYIIYAQIENNLIAPKLQGNALKLPAAVILIAITIGMYMFGLVGAIVAIPIAGCIKVAIEEWPDLREATRGE